MPVLGNDFVVLGAKEDQSVAGNPDTPRVRDRALAVAGVTETANPEDVVVAELNNDRTPIIQAQQKAIGDTIEGTRVELESLFDQLPDPEVVANDLNNLRLKMDQMNQTDDFYPTDAFALTNGEVSESDMRFARNLQRARWRLETEIATLAEDKSLLRRGYDILDRYILRAPISGVEEATFRGERQGRMNLEALVTMGDEEFEQYLETKIQEARSEGVLSGNTVEALQELQEEMFNFGVDPSKYLDAALGITLDLAPIGVAVSRVGRAAIKQSLLRSTNLVSQAASVSGIKKAQQVAANLINRNAHTIDESIQAITGPQGLDPAKLPNRTGFTTVNQIATENKIVNFALDQNRKGVYGRVADESVVFAKATEEARALAKRTTANLVDFAFDRDLLGLPVVSVKFGKSDGTPFAKPNLGNVFKSIFPEGRMEEVVTGDPSKGYYFRVDKRFDEAKLTPEAMLKTEMNQAQMLYARLLGSATVVDDQINSAMAFQSEAALNNIGAIAGMRAQDMSALSFDERLGFDQVVRKLRDGPDANRRSWYSEDEFLQEYRQVATKQFDEDKLRKAYRAFVDLSDADWTFKATKMLQTYVAKGYEVAIKIGDDMVPAKRLTQGQFDALARDIEILDPVTRKVYSKSDVKGVHHVYKTFNGPYFYRPGVVENIGPEHVMSYNAGGGRRYTGQVFVGSFDGDNAKFIINAQTEAQGKKAAAELDAIGNVLRQFGGDLSKLNPVQRVMLDDVISKNNSWNRMVETVDDLIDIRLKYGYDFTKRATWRKDNEALNFTNPDVQDTFQGMSISEFVSFNNRRQDPPLMNVGGTNDYIVSPFETVANQFRSSSFQFAFNSYTRRAKNSWVRLAQNENSGWSAPGVDPNDTDAWFANAVQTGTTENSQSLYDARRVIEMRLAIKSKEYTTMENYLAATKDYVLGVTNGRVNIDNLKPVENLLRLGFQSAFGFFNFAQATLQSFHVINIAAVAGRNALAGGHFGSEMRKMYKVYDQATLDEFAKRGAKFYDIPEDRMKEAVRFWRESGRMIIEGDAIEDGTGFVFGIAGSGGADTMLNRGLNAASKAGKGVSWLADKGLAFYKFGERTARSVSLGTAIVEHIKKFPDEPLTSPRARAWIASRDNTLSLRMTTVDRGWYQQGLARIPFQWFSYNLRALEAIALGRGFSAAERARLAAALTVTYGAAGFGFPSAADYMAEKLGLTPDSPLVTGMKWGLLDGVFDLAIDAPGSTPALGARLAPAMFFTDTYKNLVEGQFIEVVGGPGVEIAGNLSGSLYAAVASWFGGRSGVAQAELVEALRGFSGIDNIYKATMIYNNSLYLSRRSGAVPVQVNTHDAIISLSGYTPLKVTEFYQSNNTLFTSDRDFRTIRKELGVRAEQIVRLSQGDDADQKAAIKMAREVSAIIQAAPLSSEQRRELENGLLRDKGDDLVDMYQRLVRIDRNYEAERLRIYNQGTE